MIDQLFEYIKSNPQEVMFQAVLSVAVVILVAVAATIRINQYRYRKHQGFGRKYFESEAFDKSIEELKIARKLAEKPISGKKRDRERTSSLLAEVAIVASRWDEAIQALTECITIAPEKMEYHVSLVENYLRVEKSDLAREALDKALQLITPAKLDELAKERVYAITRNREDEGIGQELARLEGSMAVCRSERLDRLEILNPDFEGRRFILEGLLQGEEDAINLAKFYIRGYILEKNRLEKGGAEEKGEEVETQNAGQEEGILAEEQTPKRMEIQEAQEEPAQVYREPHLMKARETLDGLETEPESSAFYTLSAFLSAEEGNPKAAEESYKKAVALDPQHSEAYYRLALLCVDKFDDPERAIGNLRNAVESNPAFAAAHHNLALLLMGSGEDTWEVKHHLGEAMKIDSRFSEVYYNLGLLLARKDFKAFFLG
uniref:Tetratricopeptide repeat-containing protein n=1 Tax=Candidatus Kentrum eta TaxID=2126337 RepID=A0A450UJ05_9GAMM|nr:MAG: Tetratricopeptide repeat-containing protein [Candidatus Kentron sp. H]VFJ92487.1 MAG: Tetratricopeptide repeat-containing protein [Candidatus Kentron sp. H]VFJ99265.1 MAG: Tetratricopeptide repeat-containing protein [Candidatus Kentron sp. H]